MKKSPKALKLLAICVSMLLLCSALVACGKVTSTTPKNEPILKNIVLYRAGSENRDTENALCLVVVDNKCEDVFVELNFDNAQKLAINTVKINGDECTPEDGATAQNVVIKYQPPEKSGNIAIEISKITYKVDGMVKSLAKFKSTVFVAKIAPTFNVTFDFSESAAPQSEHLQTSTIDFMDKLENMNKFYNADIMDEMNVDGGTNYGKEGYIFTGWFTTPTPPEGVEDNGIKMNGNGYYDYYYDMTLYARYTKILKSKKMVDSKGGEYMVITGIAEEARKLYLLNIPNQIDGITVKEIAPHAFTSSLASMITLNKDLLKIGSGAFSSIKSDVIFNDNLEEIGDNSFNGCSGIKNVSFPASLKIIGANAFQGCGWDTVYDNKQKFYSTLIIPNTVVSIGSEAFKYSTFSAVYFMQGSAITKENFGDKMFDGSKSLATACTSTMYTQLSRRLTLAPDGGLAYISKAAFANCTALTDSGLQNGNASGLNLAEGLVEIDEYAFNKIADTKVGNLKAVTLPNSLVTIGTNAFGGSGLHSLNFKDGENTISALRTIGDWAFSECNFVEVHLYTKNLLYYKASPFYNNMELRSIFIYADSVPLFMQYNNEPDGGAAKMQGLSDFVKYYVNGDNAYLDRFKNEWMLRGGRLDGYKPVSVVAYCKSAIATDTDGIRYTIDDYEDKYGDDDSTVEKPEIKWQQSGTRIVGVFPLYNTQTGKYGEPPSVRIPANLNGKKINSIGTRFAYASLRSLTFEAPGNIEDISPQAFYKCKDFNIDLSILTNLKVIGYRAFYGTNYSGAFVSQSTLRIICKQAFYLCEKLTSVKLIDGDKLWVQNEAFSSTGITTVSISKKVELIENAAFAFCKSLREVFIQHTTLINHSMTMSVGVFAQSGAGTIIDSDGVSESLSIYLPSAIAVATYKGDTYPNGERNFYRAYAKNYKIGAFQ